MFTAIARSLLVKHASPFIEVEGLDLNIEKGNIHLENVRLKETALAALDLPIDVTFGIVKRVVIQIPWTALTKKPTIVIIDGIHALIRNRTDFSGDEAAQQKLQRALHMRGIDSFERTLAEEEERDKELEKNDGKKKQDGADALISSKFLVSIVDNLQVTIRNIHLRYVDETSFIGHRCAIGLAINEITVYPFDRKHKRKFDPANAKAFRQAMLTFYAEVSPQKTAAEVDAILAKWTKKEDVLFDQLEARYGKCPDFQLDVGGTAQGSDGAPSAQGAGTRRASAAGKAGAKKPKFILKKFEINDVFLYIDPDVAEDALRFDGWDKPDVICGIMGAVFDPVNEAHALADAAAAAAASTTTTKADPGSSSTGTTLRTAVETGASQRVGWVNPRSHLLLPLSLKVSFKSYQSTANRDLPLFEIAVGGGGGAEDAGDGATSTVALRVSPDQFGALAAIADNLTNYRKYSRLRGRRPKNTRPNTDPRGWWQYVIHAVVVQVRDHLGSRSWVRLIELLRVRQQYLQLYRAKVKQPTQPGGKKSQVDRALAQLDATLPSAQAKYFRTIVRRDNKKQRMMKAAARKEKKALGNWFQRKFATPEMRKKLELNKKQLRAAQKEWDQLQEQIDASYVEVTPWDQMHAEDIVAVVDVRLHIAVDLVTDARPDTPVQRLLSVGVQGVEVYIKAMAAFQEIHVAVADLEIRDECTEGTLFPYVMVRTRSPEERARQAAGAAAGTGEQSLLAVDIHLPPKSKDCDVQIDVVGQPLDITLSPAFLLGLVERFNVSQPLNLQALQDMLLESIGLLRVTDQDVLTRSKRALQKADPTMSLNLKLQIGTVYVPEDVCDITKTILAVNLGEVEVSIAGHQLVTLREDGEPVPSEPAAAAAATSGGGGSAPAATAPAASAPASVPGYKYMPINVAVRNFSATLLPETCPEPLIKHTDLTVALLIVDPREKELPATMPNVKIALSMLPIVVNLAGTTFNRLLQTIASTVLLIPTENLVPPDEKALADSMHNSGIDLFFERDATQARLRKRMHDQSVKFVDFDERVLSVLQGKNMMQMELDIPAVEVRCLREATAATAAAAGAAAPMLHVKVAGFTMGLKVQPYDTHVDMQLQDIAIEATNVLPDGTARKLDLLTFAGKDPATGQRESPVFVMAVRGAKPLSAQFAALRGTSEVDLRFDHYLQLDVTRGVLVDLMSFFVLNIPFDALAAMEFKTKTAKSLLFDPAEVMRRNRANNGGVDMCRESLELAPGEFQHFFALSRVDIAVQGVVVRALLDDCKSGLLEARVRHVVLGMCRETQAMEIDARVLGLAVLDLTEAGQATPTVLRAGDVHGRPQAGSPSHGRPARSPGVLRPEVIAAGQAPSTLTAPSDADAHQPFVDVSVWMFDPFKGSPPDLFVKASIQTIMLTVLNRFVMGVVGYAADSRLQGVFADIDEATPTPEKFVAVDHSTGKPIPPRLILPEVDVTMHGIAITVPTYTGADTYAIMGINGISLKNVPPPQGKAFAVGERTQIAVAVEGMYMQLQCEALRRVVDFLRIDSLTVDVLMLGKKLTCSVDMSPLDICFSVQHFSALLGLLNNIKEQPQVCMTDDEVSLLQENMAKGAAANKLKHQADARGAEAAPTKAAPAGEGDVDAPAPALKPPEEFPLDEIIASIKFGGMRCQLLKDLPKALDGDGGGHGDADGDASERISLFALEGQPQHVLDAVRAETVSVMAMGPLSIDATVTGGGSSIEASIGLEYFKVLDRRPETLEHYVRLAQPSARAGGAGATGSPGDGGEDEGDAPRSSNYTASLQAFGTVVHLEGTAEDPFLHVMASVQMNPDAPGRLRRVKLSGGVNHIHVTYSDLIMKVMTIFEPPELPPVPDHVAALFNKSAEMAAAAAAAAAESASDAMDDDFMTDLLRGALEIEVGLKVASGGVHILFAEAEAAVGHGAGAAAGSNQNVPAGFLLQWDGIHVKVGSRGLRHIVVRAGVDGIRLGVRQVGLALEQLNVPQQSRDIIPSFSVAVGVGTKVPKARRLTLEQLDQCNTVDDMRNLQLTLRVTVTRIKVFVSSYIAMKAVRMITSAQATFGAADRDGGAEAPAGGAGAGGPGAGAGASAGAGAGASAGAGAGAGAGASAGAHARGRAGGPVVGAERAVAKMPRESRMEAEAAAEEEDSYRAQALAVAEKMAHTSKVMRVVSKAAAAATTTTAAADGDGVGVVSEGHDSAAAAEPAIKRARSLGLSLLAVDMRVQLAGIDVFVAADLPTTNFGVSFHVDEIIVNGGAKRGRLSVETEFTLSSQFQQALRQPFIETTKMHANVKFSCANLLPAAVLAYQFDGPQQLRSFLDKSVPLEVDFLTEEVLNINIRQNMISVAIHCIDSVVAFVEDVDATVDQANRVSSSEQLRQWEREKVTLNVKTLRNDTGLPLQARFCMAWNNGGVDTTWPSISIPAWRTLEHGETMVVELPFYVYEKMVDQTLEVQFPNSKLLHEMGHSSKEVFSFSSYDLKTFTSSRSAHVLALHGSHNYTILSSRVACVPSMDLGLELRPVRRDIVRTILLNLRPGTLAKESRLYTVATRAQAHDARQTLAGAAALRPGDYVFQVDGDFLASSKDLAAVFAEHVASGRPLHLDVIRQSQRPRAVSRFSDVKLVFEKQCGGSMMSLRSELTIRNDLTVPMDVQFFLLHDGRQGAWERLADMDMRVEPDHEFAVPFQVVLASAVYVRVRPVLPVQRGQRPPELAFSPLYQVQALCQLQLDPTERRERAGDQGARDKGGFVPSQPAGGAAAARSMTPRLVEEAALVDQAGVSFEAGVHEMYHCVLDVRRDAIGTPQLSLVPAYRVQNLLPIDVEILIQVVEGEDASFVPVTLSPTQKVSICNADRNARANYALMTRLVGCPHLPKWSDPLNRMSRLGYDEGTIIVEDLLGNHLRLQFAATNSVVASKFYDLCVFAPFWVVNCTGYPFLFSAQGGNLSATAQPGRKGRNTVKIKARNNTHVPGIIETLAAGAGTSVLGGGGKDEQDPAPKLQTQCNLTFLSDASMTKKKLSVRMKLEGTEEAWTGAFNIGDEGGAVNITVPCTKTHLAVSANNVPLPAMFSRSKLVFLQPRYVVYNNTGRRLWIRQVMSIKHASKDAADSIHASDQHVDAHSQVPFYFRDALFGFVQFLVDGAADDSWSGAIDIQSFGYNEIRLGAPGASGSGGGGGGGGGAAAAAADAVDGDAFDGGGASARAGSGSGRGKSSADLAIYHQAEVFETRAIIYVKLTELAPQNVYTCVSNTCLNEYVVVEQALVDKEGTKNVSKACPSTVQRPADGIPQPYNVFSPHSERPYVVDHPTLPPVVNVVVCEPSHTARATGYLKRVGTVRVDLRECSKQATDFSVMVPADNSTSSVDHHVIVRLQLVDGITKLHVFRVRADDSQNVMTIPAYLAELAAIDDDSRGAASSAPSNRLRRAFAAHTVFLRHFLKASNADRMLRQFSGNAAPATRRVQSKMVLQVRGVGISIIADHPAESHAQSYELLYISLTDLFLWHELDNQKRMNVEAHLGEFQIDSAAQGTSYPVLLHQYRHVRAQQEAERKGSPQYFLAVNLVSEHHEAIDYYDYINVLMQAVVLKFDTPFLNEVLQLVAEISAEVEALGQNDHLQKQELKGILVKHTELAPNVVNTNRRVYVQKLLLQPIKLSLCYTPVGRYKEIGQVSGAVRGVLNMFGGFAKIDADVMLPSYLAESVADNSNMFANAVKKHYINTMWQQVLRVVFGLQTLGNPMKLFSNLGTGVKQLYYEPSQGAVLGTKEFMTGLGRGTMDFLGGVTMGVTGLASAGLETVASAMEQLSFNKDYIAGRQAHRARAPKNALHGLGKAGKGVALGIGRGLAGIFIDPVKGAQEGAKQSPGHAIGGFFKGVGQGLLGVVVKPTAAVVSGTATVMDGINHNVSLETSVRHVRLPRFLQNNIISDYSDREGLANILVRSMNDNIANTTLGVYIFHMMCDGSNKQSKEKAFLLMTSEFIIHGTLALAADRHYSHCNSFELRWKVPLDKIDALEVSGKSIAVVLAANASSPVIVRGISRTASRSVGGGSGGGGGGSDGGGGGGGGGGAVNGDGLAVQAAYAHDALIFLRLFLRVKEEFQVAARFLHQLRTWLAAVDRKLPGKQREAMAKRDPLVLAELDRHHGGDPSGGAGGGDARRASPVAARAEDGQFSASGGAAGGGGGGGGADAAGGAAGDAGDEPGTPGLQDTVLREMMKTGHFIVRSAYASGIERRSRATAKFFSKRVKQYCVVKLTVEGITLDSVNQTVFLELTKTYKDFKALRQALRSSKLPDERAAWGSGSEDIWKRLSPDVQEDQLHFFVQLVRSMVGNGVLGFPQHKIPALWKFFTDDFEFVGGTRM